MKIRTMEYFLRETLSSLRRNSMMTVASIGTVALSLLILGIFLAIVLNLNHMASSLENQVMINVYLKDGLNDFATREVGTKISKVPGVVQTLYVNKDEAMQKFRERLGEQQGILTALEGNPLPDGFEVRVDKPENVKAVVQAANQLTGVENVRYGKEVIENLFQITKIIRIIGLVLILFLAFAAVFIISNTIRLTVFARRKEIGIMKYVGATDWFIRWPFMLEGIVMGTIGALIAVLLLSRTYIGLTQHIYNSMAFLPLIPKYPFLTHLTIVLLVLGALIGALGSAVSLRRFLKV